MWYISISWWQSQLMCCETGNVWSGARLEQMGAGNPSGEFWLYQRRSVRVVPLWSSCQCKQKWKQQVTQKESSLMGYKLRFPCMWSQLIKLFCTAAMKDAPALEPSPAFPSAGIKYPKPLRDFACFVYLWAVSPSNTQTFFCSLWVHVWL
jgi:hypothetical protein